MTLPDEAMLDEIYGRLQLFPHGDDLEKLTTFIKELPPGLRAMAATHCLDVSMTLDDLGWHFLDFGQPVWVDETRLGLLELGLVDVASWFEEAYQLMKASPPITTTESYNRHLQDGTRRGARFKELSALYWSRQEQVADRPRGSMIYSSWVQYARRHPEKVFFVESSP